MVVKAFRMCLFDVWWWYGRGTGMSCGMSRILKALKRDLSLLRA